MEPHLLTEPEQIDGLMAPNVHLMEPKNCKFPCAEVFEVPDSFNGPIRGTFWFICPFERDFHGPFKSRINAELVLSNHLMG